MRKLRLLLSLLPNASNVVRRRTTSRNASDSSGDARHRYSPIKLLEQRALASPPPSRPSADLTSSPVQFWTQDYRTGFTTLYEKLEAGLVESEELIGNVKRRAAAERSMGLALQPPALRHDGFGLGAFTGLGRGSGS